MRRAVALALLAAVAVPALGEGPRQIKVAIGFEESGREDHDAFGGSGSVVITRKGGASGSAALDAQGRSTEIRRTSGVFTLVQDGGSSSIRMVTRVPAEEIAYYHDYATGAGYLSRDVRFDRVGTSLRVQAQTVDGERIHLRLTPEVSYFSPDGSGAIELTDAATELVVRSGERIVIGGASRSVSEATRRVLGVAGSRSERESTVTLTATLQ